MKQPNLALHAIRESLPPTKIKRSTDEIFSEPQRLHKVLASCGFGSRRAMEEMILAGRITVNRAPAEVGQKVGPGDEVRINGELVKVRFTEPRPRVLMYHKPAGEIVTRDDPEGRPTVFARLPNIGNGKWINVGRLDYNTEGLLLFTNSGELANRLMHPRYEVEREYAVRVIGRMSDEQRRALLEGIALEDGPAKCDSVEDGGGEEEGANHWYHVVLKEGRNREVRRLFEALNLPVSRLIRTRYGTLAMPSVLKRGDLLELEAADVNAVMEAAGLRGGARPAPGARPQGGQPHSRQPGPGGGPRPAPGPGGGRPGAGPRPHGKQGKRRGKGGPRNAAPGGPGANAAAPRGPRPDFETTQPLSNANAIGLRPHGKGPRRGGAVPGGGPRPQRPRVDFDEMQPANNANASPFGRTTLTVPGGVPRGVGEAGNALRGNRSGPRGRPGGQQRRGKGGQGGQGAQGGQAHRRGPGGPRGERDGNVAPRERGINPVAAGDDRVQAKASHVVTRIERKQRRVIDDSLIPTAPPARDDED
ncbi:MAG: rRNA pseudouridine synthase [Betaproteobacteria bacterium]|nr:rRNA pseudouridine synthase [Betaproteobacteria bacterium]MCC7217431.1 rRNA pseudouridine synthase [Burkholderiales bacterium]